MTSAPFLLSIYFFTCFCSLLPPLPPPPPRLGGHSSWRRRRWQKSKREAFSLNLRVGEVLSGTDPPRGRRGDHIVTAQLPVLRKPLFFLLASSGLRPSFSSSTSTPTASASVAMPVRTLDTPLAPAPPPVSSKQPGVSRSLLYNGSRFVGHQRSKGNQYDVEVILQVREAKHSRVRPSFLFRRV